VDRTHIELLEVWKQLLESPAYLEAQASPWKSRPWHMKGDQDALTALLGSRRFADIRFKLLRNGRDIAHCFEADGYSFRARLAHAFRPLPQLLHAQGVKPWRAWHDGGKPLSLVLSPFVFEARSYSSQVDDDMDWCKVAGVIPGLLQLLALGDPGLSGAMHAMSKSLLRYTRNHDH
jgi:hypothetical protein